MYISAAASGASVFGASISAVAGSRHVASPAPGKARQSVIKIHKQRRESAVEKTSSPTGSLNLKHYFQQSLELVRASDDDGPPRWFSPLECGSRVKDSPLLLYLPG